MVGRSACYSAMLVETQQALSRFALSPGWTWVFSGFSLAPLDIDLSFIILSNPMVTDDLEKQAVQAAIKGSWQQAVDLNRQLIKENPKNIAALNRLARAYWELGKISQAQKTYRKVLTLDPYNSIANKNLQRIVQKRKKLKKKKIDYPSNLFLEEPGKTKTIKLIRLASIEVLSELSNGFHQYRFTDLA